MSGKRLAEPSPESIARANRQRLAVEEGARAMADLERQAIEVRKNMERLRALREAKEAEGKNSDGSAGNRTEKTQEGTLKNSDWT
jgi:hypothetical protein